MGIATIKRYWGESPNGSDSQGKIINDFHVKRLMNLIDTSKGEIMYGGKCNEKVKHIEPTIILNPSHDSPLMQEEIFGPIMPIFTYENMEQVIKYINGRPKPLAVYFYGNPTSPDSLKLYNRTSSGAYMT